jgi:L-alanine-DL-glutamate epimerase-like enolase superfamily enzyme
MKLHVRQVDWKYTKPFRISYKTIFHSETVLAELHCDGCVGRGEGLPVFYLGDSIERMLQQIENVREQIERGATREDLLQLLPPGGARNAIDCALWDLEAKRSGRRVWDMVAGPRREVISDLTIGLDTTEEMAATARQASNMPRLKLKLAGDGDAERVAAVRRARPDAELLVDANQAWSTRHLEEFIPLFVDLGVKLIEQPFPADDDEALRGFDSPIPICADKSCQTTESLPGLAGKYSYVNIKLDKTGGLTEALCLADQAEAAGFKLMVGCMGGSSLAMAPGMVVAQRCDFVDLDGPLLNTDDVDPPITFVNGRMELPRSELWG